MTETPPIPQTSEEIRLAVDELLAQVDDPDVAMNGNQDGYGKCVEAMWQAGYLVTEYVAKKLGVTGFQGSMAMLQLYGQSMRIDGPYMVLKAEEALYPQYDLHAQVTDWLERCGPWLVEQATARLSDADKRAHAAPQVVAHWQALIDNTPTDIEEQHA